MPETQLAAMVTATEYVVSLLPDEIPDADLWQIRVEYRGRDRWAVCRSGRCLARDGSWSWESSALEVADHRFPRDEAIARAVQAVHDVTSNGLRAVDVLARWKAKEAQRS